MHPRDVRADFLLGFLGAVERPFEGVLPGAEKQFAVDPAHPVAAKVRGGAVSWARIPNMSISLSAALDGIQRAYA